MTPALRAPMIQPRVFSLRSPHLGARLVGAAVSLAACRASPRRVETVHAVTAPRVVADVPAVVDAAAPDAVVIDSGVDAAAVVEDVASAPEVEPEAPVNLSRFETLRRGRLINDPVVVLELLQDFDFWAPMSDGACARLRFRLNERGEREVTAGGYTARLIVWASTHRRGQPAEFSFNDPQFRLFDAFPANARGVLMFLVGDSFNTRYRLAWDGTSLAVTTANSIAGNAVVRLHPERRTCLPEAAEFHNSRIAP